MRTTIFILSTPKIVIHPSKIRDNRHKEKIANRQDEAFSLGEDESKTDAPSKARSNDEEPISPILEMIKQQLEERLNEK